MKFYGRPQAVTVTVSVPKVELLLALLKEKLIPEPEKAVKLDPTLLVAFTHFSPADLKLACEQSRLDAVNFFVEGEFAEICAVDKPFLVVAPDGSEEMRLYRTFNTTTGITTEWEWDDAKAERVAVRELRPRLVAAQPESGPVETPFRSVPSDGGGDMGRGSGPFGRPGDPIPVVHNASMTGSDKPAGPPQPPESVIEAQGKTKKPPATTKH